MEYNERLRTLRIERDLVQADVANALGVTYQSYQAYERGVRKPGLDLSIALADFYGVSLDYLAGRTDNPDINQ